MSKRFSVFLQFLKQGFNILCVCMLLQDNMLTIQQVVSNGHLKVSVQTRPILTLGTHNHAAFSYTPLFVCSHECSHECWLCWLQASSPAVLLWFGIVAGSADQSLQINCTIRVWYALVSMFVLFNSSFGSKRLSLYGFV